MTRWSTGITTAVHAPARVVSSYIDKKKCIGWIICDLFGYVLVWYLQLQRLHKILVGFLDSLNIQNDVNFDF